MSPVYVVGCAYLSVLFQSSWGHEEISLIIPQLGYDSRRAQLPLQALSLHLLASAVADSIY